MQATFESKFILQNRVITEQSHVFVSNKYCILVTASFSA